MFFRFYRLAGAPALSAEYHRAVSAGPHLSGMESVIQAEGLVKSFGETTALAGVDLAARRGTVLGLLGPNGSGKTTTVRILTTLLRPDGGRAARARPRRRRRRPRPSAGGSGSPASTPPSTRR